uniref:Protein Mpv17 n=1 Tax=Tetraselmis sp. GSL018 TaxID=582737 RepID=A0A061SD31_9CHLO|mmetsp:Transcript_1955/g.4600  ORF Transcript_1955/g.4600 Transcript_1955/m.4600 type:complete len:268 (-) Transcript_1955:183-986(-)|eukprot:CAMPEP_0177588536 /NCGR_PEP_ID=MMETSP0419_2-20121207/6279_1 /TAXON_ID=582737 /ORGANISM="Tetraselmis sp., Strain GSL018" /LENGTH=267 /DNA_ID=CAMNT_0019078743 /DNA_START=218 /DNA_END=1021 /DNA_ORIENTATION=-
MENTRHRGYYEKTSSQDESARDEAIENGRLSEDRHSAHVSPAEVSKASGHLTREQILKTAAKGGTRPSSPLRTSERKPVAHLSLWEEYCTSLETNPLLTKSLTSFTGFLIADQTAQIVTGVFLDYKRLARMCMFGLTCHGPMCHYWYKGLDEVVLPNASKSTAAVVLKILLDQLFFAPTFLVVFWFFLKLLEGHPEAAYTMVVDKLFSTLLVSYLLWPVAHFINFRFIPSSQRLLYINVVTIFWTTYLSWSSCQSGQGSGTEVKPVA